MIGLIIIAALIIGFVVAAFMAFLEFLYCIWHDGKYGTSYIDEYFNF